MAEEFSALLKPLHESESIEQCVGKYLWLIITLPITVWFMLTFPIHMPNCHLQQLYLPSLDLISNTHDPNITAINPTLFFDLKLENTMNDHSIRYGDINLIFYYGPNRNVNIANYTVPGFYQGKEKTAYRRDVVDTHDLPWNEAMRKVSNGSTAVFRVDLVAKPTFRYWFWYSKKRWLRVGAKFEINATGKKTNKSAIELKSAAAYRDHRLSGRVGIFVLFSVLLPLVL
ncbi:hypothetical protein BUALT_Bualt14G0054800 [Buddleja alternifolia]|uniref:Protein NDR1-like n=1 Tax=Buddleja alternifolia TaxID=168488 RepID=A0AAV6WSD2_9LAMI|nr:hypothetical protein BUALT_Bualt14G0054800 [Buddleja alternifolia]